MLFNTDALYVVVFTILIHAGAAAAEGFLDLDQVRKGALQVEGYSISLPTHPRQQVFPSINFTCDANITEWIALARSLIDLEQAAEFQVWRSDGNGTYSKILNASSFAEGVVCNGTLCRYSRTGVPLMVKSGDVFGLHQPPRENNSLRVYYQPRGGPVSYSVTQLVSSPSKISADNTSTSTELPLVAVTTEPSGCAEGFLEVAALELYANQNLQLRTCSGTHRIFPALTFNCNVTETKWLIGAYLQYTASQHPRLEKWRVQSDGYYARVETRNITNLTSTDYLNLYEFVPSPPLDFQAGDILGLWQPELEDNLAVIYYEALGGERHYVLSGNTETTEEKSTSHNLQPLIKAVTGGNFTDGCTSGFIGQEELQDRAGDIVLLRVHPGEQRIIPGINFTADGLLYTWSFAARFNKDGEHFPEFQIWRTTKLNEHMLINSTSEYGIVPVRTGYLNVYEYRMDPPMAIRAGDYLGIYQPVEDISQLILLFAEGSGPVDYYFNATEPLSELINTSGTSFDHDNPLVAGTVVAPMATDTPVLSTTTIVESSPTLMTTGSDGVTPITVKAVGGAVGFAVGVLATILISVLLICLVMRRRKKDRGRNPALQPEEKNDDTLRNLTNPVYGGDLTVTDPVQLSHNGDTKPHVYEPTYEPEPTPLSDSVYLKLNHQLQANNPSQPLGENYHSLEPPEYSHLQLNGTESNRTSFYDDILGQGAYVPAEAEREALKSVASESVYYALSETQSLERGRALTFFEETDVYWTPSSKEDELYKQLSQKKYREVVRHQIEILDVIGTGEFGQVNKGVWRTPTGTTAVAIKTLQVGATKVDRVKFLQESAITGQFKHPNVVKLHGVVTVGEPVMILLELLHYGDLQKYLVKMKPNEQLPMETENLLLGFCNDVAAGMEYLTSKAFVHRDLAARNILLAKDKTCKIGDFGLSRDLEHENYYIAHGGKIPVKWTAPEALNYRKYSTASDVWSYGVVMYEIWSLGHKPLEGYSNSQTLGLLETGVRLSPPPGCPREIYKLMIDCWHPESSSRPSFSSIIQSLSHPPSQLLGWSEEDKSVHPLATVLGAPLEAGKGLYQELQETYLYNNS